MNPIRFLIRKYLSAIVDKSGHVLLGEYAHYYSVPHTLINKRVQIYYTSTDVEVWSGYEKIAQHPRSRHRFRHTTDPAHLCPHHRAVAEWSPDMFISQAAQIPPDVEYYIRKILLHTSYLDEDYKFCSGILNFAGKVGPERLAAACRLADSYGRYRPKEIRNILENQSDMIDSPEDEELAEIPEHENIRGAEYYQSITI